MARCRDFVRQKASTFDERAREAEETEMRARQARQRELEEQRAREWQAIADWHQNLEAWEATCMAAVDERLARLVALQRLEEAELAEAASAGQAVLTTGAQQAQGKSRRRHSSESSDDETAEVLRRDGDRGRDGGRDRDRRRRERSRSRRRRRSAPRSPEVATVLQPPPRPAGAPAAGAASASAGGAPEEQRQSGLVPQMGHRRFSEMQQLNQVARSQQRLAQQQVHEDMQARMKAQEVQNILRNVGGNVAAQAPSGKGQAYDPAAPPRHWPGAPPAASGGAGLQGPTRPLAELLRGGGGGSGGGCGGGGFAPRY